MALVELREVSKAYGDVPVLDKVSLRAEPGRITVILGPSGSGKTTLLRIIAGLEEPDEGEVLINGENVQGLDPRKRGVAMVFQSPSLFPHMTGRENVLFAAEGWGTDPGRAGERLKELVRLLDLDKVIDRLPEEMSGGQQQRVALARALVVEPRVLLLDEPLSNLDAPLREEMKALFRRVRREFKLTMIYVTHDQDEALELADSIVVLYGGRIVGESSEPYNYYLRPGSPEAAHLFNHNLLYGSLAPDGSIVFPWESGSHGGIIIGFPPEAVSLEHCSYRARVVDSYRQRGRGTVVLDVGGVRLRSFLGPGRPLPNPGDEVCFDVEMSLVSVYGGWGPRVERLAQELGERHAFRRL